MTTYTVGQKLWFVPNDTRRRPPSEVTITRVGRKWIETDSWYRFAIETLVADGKGYASPGRCYLSREEHERVAALARAWYEFRCKVNGQARVPDGVTIERVQQAEQLLFGDGDRQEKERS